MRTQRTRAEDLHFPMTNPAFYHLIMYTLERTTLDLQFKE